MARGVLTRLPLSAWALLLIAACCVSGVSAGGHEWGHRWRGCSGFPTSAGCKFWRCDRNSCTGDCGAGKLPAQATCQLGTWVVTRTCGCQGVPAFHNGCQKWTCDGYACTGTCSWGQPAKATCMPSGAWNTTQTCVPPAPVCPTQPPACNGGVWPDCRGKSVCTGYCGKGFTGTVNAVCTAKGWQVTSQCTPVGAGCPGLPPACGGISWSPRCTGKTYCGSNCLPGYTGYVYSKCVNGQWTVPKGQCTPKTQGCSTLPPAQPNAKPWCATSCIGKTSCTTACAGGCSGKGYTAICKAGKWEVMGGCSASKHMWGWTDNKN